MWGHIPTPNLHFGAPELANSLIHTTKILRFQVMGHISFKEVIDDSKIFIKSIYTPNTRFKLYQLLEEPTSPISYAIPF